MSEATRIHQVIMNLPDKSNPDYQLGEAAVRQRHAYGVGHRDARHAAADLAREAVAKLEAERDEARAGYRQLDANWASLHNVGMTAIREALGMPEGTVPEMVERIGELRLR